MFFRMRPCRPSPLVLRAAAAMATSAWALPSNKLLCSPEEDRLEFKRVMLASGLNPSWFEGFERVGVGTVLDACTAFDSNLTLEPPSRASITALLDGARHHSTASGADAWPSDADAAYSSVRANIIKLARFCTALRPAATARAAAHAGLVLSTSSSSNAESEETVMLKNKDENAEKLYATAQLLYNRSWASDVRASNTQLLQTHLGFKRGTLKMAAITSGQYGVLDAIVRPGHLALTQTEDRVGLAEAENTVDLRRLVPAVSQINRALESLVVAGQEEVLPSQTAAGGYGFVMTSRGRKQIQMDLTAAELAKNAFLALANIHSATQLQQLFTHSFVRNVDLKMKNNFSCSAGIQEIIYHSAALTPVAAPSLTTTAPDPPPGGGPDRTPEKRKAENESETAKLRKELKAAETARDHNARTLDQMKTARDRRATGKGGGRGGGGYSIISGARQRRTMAVATPITTTTTTPRMTVAIAAGVVVVGPTSPS